MSDGRLSRRECFALLTAGAIVLPVCGAWAADGPTGPAGGEAPAGPAPMRAELVKTGLYLIAGGGGNTLLRLSAAGAVLINGKAAGMYRPLMSQVRRISRLSDLPVRVLMLTDVAEHHASNQALFASAGVATLVQQDAQPLLPAPPPMAASGVRAPAAVVTFDREYRLRIGGVEVKMIHVGPARTPVDTVVLFPDLKVLAVGDLYTTVEPTATMAPAGGLAGWSQALGQALDMDFELAVPSEGPPVPRAELVALKARLDALPAANGPRSPKASRG